MIRLKEHLSDEKKDEEFDRMQIISENLNHDQARTLEAIEIRARLEERIAKYKAKDLIKDQLEASGLLNKNRSRDIVVKNRKYEGNTPKLDEAINVECK